MYALPNSLPYVDLLPGPFILLFLIPLLPLALFSLGARPPAFGSGSGPSPLSDELWRTTALLAGAVTVALCVGVYPDSMTDVVAWVKDGRLKVGAMGVGAGGGNWMGWGQVWNRAGTVAGVRSGVRAGGKRMMSPEMARRIIKSRKPSFDRIAANHIAAIRYYHPKLYNASQPRLSSVVGLGLVIVGVVIITWGKVLTSIYISDKTPPPRPSSSQSSSSSSKSKGPSEWVMKEYGLRKKETKEITKERFKLAEKELTEKYKKKKKTMEAENKKDEYEKFILKKSAERRKDVEDLKKMLEAKTIEPVGLDKDPGWMIKAKGSEAGDEAKVAAEEDKSDGKNNDKDKKKDEVVGKLTMGDKIRKALLGNVMTGSIKKDKAKPPSTPVPEVVTIQPVAARGPGWEVADTPAAGVALAKSAGAAEALARGMGK